MTRAQGKRLRPLFFYLGLFSLLALELARIWFIMPMPGAQEVETLDFAYTLHQWRWPLRILCLGVIWMGALGAWRGRGKWFAIPTAIFVAAGTYMANFVMSADAMFKEPATLAFAAPADSKLDANAVVLSVAMGGEAKAYPIRYIVYHHQVRDTVGGAPVMVTYCSVCRTGRAFDPRVGGELQEFRLVGMDHFNAMFEDKASGRWWRQVSGRAVTGKRKGEALVELPSQQLTLAKFTELYPNGKVMLADASALEGYDTSGKFESGESKGTLTGTNPASWENKSWVVGVEIGDASRAYDWNELAAKRVITDEIAGVPVVIALAKDNRSFAAWRRPDASPLALDADSLIAGAAALGFKPLKASQEFWHSWRT